MSLALYRNKQFGVKLEGTAGSAETLTASDYGIELTEMGTEAGVEMVDVDVFKNSLSASTSRSGKKVASVSVSGEFKNSGTLNTEPKVSTLLQASRLTKFLVQGMAISAVTGAITRGISVITGGTSNAIGIAVAVEGGNKLYVAVVSGTFQSGEALTSAPAGFSATAGTQDAAKTGFSFIPKSDTASEKTITINMLDGLEKKWLFGGVSNLNFELSTDSYPKFSGSITGILNESNWGVAGTAVTGITYETETAEIVNNAVLNINGSIAPITSKVAIDLGNSTIVLKDLNSDTWLKYGVITDRNVTGTLDVLTIDPATYDVFADLFAGTTASLEFVIGSGAGKKIEVVVPAIQYLGISDTDQDGFSANTLSFKATGSDNELLIWFR